MLFKLEKPNISAITPDQISRAFASEHKVDLFDFIKRTSGVEYLYWDKIKYKEPSPQGMSREELWMATKIIRESRNIPSPIRDTKGMYFTWAKLEYFEKFFHELDMNTGGELFVEEGRMNKAHKQKLITRGIMEEAIASSQLEGAATSRQAAKKMLREGRKPQNQSEQMIVNSYLSMKAIEEEYKDREMSMSLITELHGRITQDTKDSAHEKPRMRKPGEPIFVSDHIRDITYYEGPDINFVQNELKRLIAFANTNEASDHFIHPVIKAVMLHFWMGYLHPFTDGNGRLARMLFYWYLVKNGYWAFVYLPISKVIKKSPMQYGMAYIYSEQDDNDLAYFIDYNLKKIQLAVKDFREYIQLQADTNIHMKKKSESRFHLNDRQIHALQYLHGDPDERTTLRAHMNVNQIAKMTASKDLKDLVKKGFLAPDKQGRSVYYYGTEKIQELFGE